MQCKTWYHSESDLSVRLDTISVFDSADQSLFGSGSANGYSGCCAAFYASKSAGFACSIEAVTLLYSAATLLPCDSACCIGL